MAEPTRDEAIKKLAELIDDIDIAMLTTRDDDGTLRSRPMSTQKEKFSGELWFFVELDSPKVEEAQHNRQVNLSYADPDDQRYVSVSGTASVVRDTSMAKKFWSPALKAWFPKGLDDPNLALLRVDVEKAEYWDAPSSKIVNVVGFVKALATGETFEPGENSKLSFGATAH